MSELSEVTAALTGFLAPYVPYLLDMAKTEGVNYAKTILKLGNEAAWEKAKKIWETIKARFNDIATVEHAANLVATDPDNEMFRTVLAKTIGDNLKGDPTLVSELIELLGGKDSVQEVLADKSSWIERVDQEIEGAGIQRIKADDHSTITDVRQRIKR